MNSAALFVINGWGREKGEASFYEEIEPFVRNNTGVCLTTDKTIIKTRRRNDRHTKKHQNNVDDTAETDREREREREREQSGSNSAVENSPLKL